MVYLIHFDKPLHHAQHYIGYANESLEQRIKRHRSGDGSKLMRAVTRAGIPWRVVRTWQDGSRDFERQLKQGKHSSRLCPICNPMVAL